MRALLSLLLLATPAAANEFKLGLSLDESATAITRDQALAATAPQRTRCLTAAEPTEDCAIELMAAGEMLGIAGAFAEAEAAGRRAVAIMVALRGASHEDTTVVQGALGTILLRAGRYREAEPVLRGALQGAASAEGDPEILSDHLMNLGIVLAEQARFAEAEALMRRALVVRLEKLPENVIAIATVRANLGALLDRMGRTADALVEHRAALTMRRDRLKAADYDLGTSMLNIAENFAKAGDASRLIAEPYLRAGLMTREFALVPGDPRTTLAQTMLGENLEGQGKAKGALEFYALAYAGSLAGSPADSPLRIRAEWNLARLLVANKVGLPMARTIYRQAAAGVMARIAAADDFDAGAREEVGRYRDVFAGQVRVAWGLGR
jgi:tetratricopeptide (TPR) repeat protein